MFGKPCCEGLPWYLVGVTSGSSAHDRDDHAEPLVPGFDPVIPTVDPSELPENVIPLRPFPVVQPTPLPSEAPALIVADPANPAHTPAPIFGRAALNLPEWPTVLVFTSLAISVLVVLLDSFRRGALLFGASMALAFFLRLVLTDREAGMLKVRSRAIDLLILGLFATSITVLAFWVPAPS